MGQKINVFLLALNKTGNNELKMELRFFSVQTLKVDGVYILHLILLDSIP